MRSRPVLFFAVASIVFAACGGSDSDVADETIPDVTLIPTTSEAPIFVEGDAQDNGDQEPASTTPITDAATTTVVTTTIAATTTVEAPPTTEAAAPAEIEPTADAFELSADGLGAVQFGADPEQSITFVSSVLGAPTADTGWLAPIDFGPCGGTRIRQVGWSQLQLEFGDSSNVTEGRDHFYAYFYGFEGSSSPQPAGLRTPEGIGAGSTVQELLAAYPGATVFEGDEFVGPTFVVNDNLAGRMSGVADDDVVEVVIGGIPCEG